MAWPPARASSGCVQPRPAPPETSSDPKRAWKPPFHARFSLGGSCASPSFPCEVVASRDAFSSRSGSEPYAPDAVLPDVTHHGNFVSASLDQCRPISLFPRGEDAELCSPDAVLPDVTCHGSFISASLDQCRPISLFPRGEDAKLCSPDAVEASRLPPVPPSPCLTSSLVCFCITCQAFFLSERKPASAPCAAPASRTARPPRRIRPQVRTRPRPATA